jgi:hypothetical protein
MGSRLNTSTAPAYPSPLWIIALFIALSEVTAGIAAIVTDGATRMIFAVFAVGFPILVLAVFLWLLIKYPANLYSPWQYTDEVGVDAYAGALSRQSRTASVVYSEAASEAVASAVAPIGQQDDASQQALRKQVVQTFEELVRGRSITIDRSTLHADAPILQIPVTDATTVSELLDAIYFEIAPVVEPFTYGKSWLLADWDGNPLTEIGTAWAKWDSGAPRDRRPLGDAGIAPGSKLRLVMLPSGHRERDRWP